MAGIVPTPGAPTGGSYGSITIGRNRYGTYQRNRTVPVNPNSPRQVAARSAFRAAVNQWTTDIQGSINADAWGVYADAVPWLNKAGQETRLSAQAMFIRYYAAAMAAFGAPPTGGGVQETPPLIFNIGTIDVAPGTDGFSLDIETYAISLSVLAATNSFNVTNGRLIVEQSLPVNPGRKFPGPRWQQVASEPMTGANDYLIEYDAGDITLPAALSQQVWFRCRGVHPLASDRRVTEQVIVGPFICLTPP